MNGYQELSLALLEADEAGAAPTIVAAAIARREIETDVLLQTLTGIVGALAHKTQTTPRDLLESAFKSAPEDATFTTMIEHVDRLAAQLAERAAARGWADE